MAPATPDNSIDENTTLETPVTIVEEKVLPNIKVLGAVNINKVVV